MSVIDIFGDIGFDYKLIDAKRDLSNIKENDITINISSYGGDVFEAIAISDLFKNNNKKIVTIGVGVVASAATILLLSGNICKLSRNAFFMIHNPSGGIHGESKDIKKYADVLDKIQMQLVSIYCDAIGKNNKYINGSRKETEIVITNMINSETWLTAEEAFNYGFISDIVEEDTFKITASASKIFKLNNFVKPQKNTDMQETLLSKIVALFLNADVQEPAAAPDAPTPTPALTEQELLDIEIADAIALLEENGYVISKSDAVQNYSAVIDILKKEIAEAKNKQFPNSLHSNTPNNAEQKKTHIPKNEMDMWQKLVNPIIQKNK